MWGSGVRVPLAPPRQLLVRGLYRSSAEVASRLSSRFDLRCAAIAPIWVRQCRDGNTYISVLYVLNGKQTSSPFNDRTEAVQFQELTNKTSPAKALEVWAAITPSADSFTVTSSCTYHLDHLTGVNKANRTRYRRCIANDIAPSKIGPMPLRALTNAYAA